MTDNPEYQREYRKRNAVQIAAYKAAWYQRNKDVSMERARRHYSANPEKAKALTAKWQADNRERVRGYQWKRRHPDFSRAERDALIVTQNGLCAACNRSLGDRPHTDHDHETGLIRGILCHNCNRGIGYLGDSIEGVEMALAYLRRHAVVYIRMTRMGNRG